MSAATSAASPTASMSGCWPEREPAEVLAGMPHPPAGPDAGGRSARERRREGLAIKPTLLAVLPPLRVLLVLDNLAGHETPEFVCWLFAHGIMPLDTPAGGSWLNRAESLQRIPKRRAPDGQHPDDTGRIIARFEAAARRRRQRERRHRIGGSGACTRLPVLRQTTTGYGHGQAT